ncbi:MAG: GNAT family N-acetyltransferase [Pseudomonadota bacterium]|nr:GNAT family N-acetyltransferase [Pseudomonadota bacterium]
MKVIETERLILRTWCEEDTEAFYRINQDPKVYEYLLGPLSREEAQHFIADMNQRFTENNFTLWAVEEKTTGAMIGFVGLSVPKFTAHFTPCVEIGWRLGSQFWGKGYAPEAAKAVLKYGFTNIGLTEIVSFTATGNLKSIRVMEKIGMHRNIVDDFNHPAISPDHRLAQHVLYRILREDINNVMK